MSEDFDILIMLGGLWATILYRRSAASGLEAAFLLWSLDVSALGEIAAAVELIAGVIALFGGAEYQFVAASGAVQGRLCRFGCCDGNLLFGNGCSGLYGLGGLGAHGLLNIRDMLFFGGSIDLRVGVKLVVDGLDLLCGQRVFVFAGASV